MRTLTSFAAAMLLALGAAACSNSTTAATTTTATTVTDTFTTALAVKGSSTRSFTMATAGTVKVALTSFGGGTQTAGLGVGVRAIASPCSLAQSVITLPSSSPQIVTTADAGTYCVQVWDTGNLTADTTFTITIEHPVP